MLRAELTGFEPQASSQFALVLIDGDGYIVNRSFPAYEKVH